MKAYEPCALGIKQSLWLYPAALPLSPEFKPAMHPGHPTLCGPNIVFNVYVPSACNRMNPKINCYNIVYAVVKMLMYGDLWINKYSYSYSSSYLRWDSLSSVWTSPSLLLQSSRLSASRFTSSPFRLSWLLDTWFCVSRSMIFSRSSFSSDIASTSFSLNNAI